MKYIWRWIIGIPRMFWYGITYHRCPSYSKGILPDIIEHQYMHYQDMITAISIYRRSHRR